MSRRLRFVAALMRTLTRAPTRSAPTFCSSPVSMNRSSSPCILSVISPISSRNMVPPSAISSLPGLSRYAPVNDPLTCPNSSDSSRVSGRPAQLTAIIVRCARGLRLWISCATSSLPTPLSPVTRILASDLATRSISSTSSTTAALVPIIWPFPCALIRFCSPETCDRDDARYSLARRRNSSRLRRLTSSIDKNIAPRARCGDLVLPGGCSRRTCTRAVNGDADSPARIWQTVPTGTPMSHASSAPDRLMSRSWMRRRTSNCTPSPLGTSTRRCLRRSIAVTLNARRVAGSVQPLLDLRLENGADCDELEPDHVFGATVSGNRRPDVTHTHLGWRVHSLTTDRDVMLRSGRERHRGTHQRAALTHVGQA